MERDTVSERERRGKESREKTRRTREAEQRYTVKKSESQE
jgi:hypothetical protein